MQLSRSRIAICTFQALVDLEKTVRQLVDGGTRPESIAVITGSSSGDSGKFEKIGAAIHVIAIPDDDRREAPDVLSEALAEWANGSTPADRVNWLAEEVRRGRLALLVYDPWPQTGTVSGIILASPVQHMEFHDLADPTT